MCTIDCCKYFSYDCFLLLLTATIKANRVKTLVSIVVKCQTEDGTTQTSSNMFRKLFHEKGKRERRNKMCYICHVVKCTIKPCLYYICFVSLKTYATLLGYLWPKTDMQIESYCLSNSLFIKTKIWQ